MERMVDITIEDDWFASLLVVIEPNGPLPSQNDFVAKAQALLATQGYALDNEVTYAVRERGPGEETRFAPDA